MLLARLPRGSPALAGGSPAALTIPELAVLASSLVLTSCTNPGRCKLGAVGCFCNSCHAYDRHHKQANKNSPWFRFHWYLPLSMGLGFNDLIITEGRNGASAFRPVNSIQQQAQAPETQAKAEQMARQAGQTVAEGISYAALGGEAVRHEEEEA